MSVINKPGRLLHISLLAFISACTSLKTDLQVSQVNYCAPPSRYVYDSIYNPLTDITPILKENGAPG